MSGENREAQCQQIIASLAGARPSLLLHACCAPCASASLEFLTRYFSVTLFFYNPNITEQTEYQKRLEELRRFVREYPFDEKIPILAGAYEPERFFELARGLETVPEGGERCTTCFALRLGETAKLAAAQGFDYCTTTLTISPLKDAERINTLGLALCEQAGSVWLPTDLKKKGRYQRSIELSREYGLYRQNFCGCPYSAREAARRQSLNSSEI